jgi:hypothetical protein
VDAERFAVRVTDERGTIHDLSGAVLARLEVLSFGQEREPAPEDSLIVAIQAEKIGGAIREGVERVAGMKRESASGAQY